MFWTYDSFSLTQCKNLMKNFKEYFLRQICNYNKCQCPNNRTNFSVLKCRYQTPNFRCSTESTGIRGHLNCILSKIGHWANIHYVRVVRCLVLWTDTVHKYCQPSNQPPSPGWGCILGAWSLAIMIKPTEGCFYII